VADSLSAVVGVGRPTAAAVDGTAAVDCSCSCTESGMVGQDMLVVVVGVVELDCTAWVHVVSAVVVEQAVRVAAAEALQWVAESGTGRQTLVQEAVRRVSGLQMLGKVLLPWPPPPSALPGPLSAR
jgi:hypothetical protein